MLKILSWGIGMLGIAPTAWYELKMVPVNDIYYDFKYTHG